MKKKQMGVSLFEMLLVLAIMSSIIVIIVGFMQQRSQEIRRDKTALQMQQILNAALSYYLANSDTAEPWPTTFIKLQSPVPYLPTAFVNKNPYPGGNPYTITIGANNSTFQLSTVVNTAAEAQVLAGRLPLGSFSGTTVNAQVSIPGQNLNNARSVNFAGIYHSGGCVPVPVCPLNMTPSILVIPVQAFGAYDVPTNCTDPDDPMTCTVKTIPLTGYTAYAVGPGNATSTTNCDGVTSGRCYGTRSTSGFTTLIAGNYYRVCLKVITERGTIQPNAVGWGKATGSVLALTRCIPAGETVGSQGYSSDFSVWTQ